jgi:6-pyruvoyltetrahydropterin/6-carboxytetrahydropterin synthase
MYTLAVSDHIMIAHSFNGEIFGPAQQLHGATYGVEVEFRRASLDDGRPGLRHRAGADQALQGRAGRTQFQATSNELPELRGRNTTTEFMAGEIFRRMALRVAQGAVGPGTAGALTSMRVVLRESPVAWASYEAALG